MGNLFDRCTGPEERLPQDIIRLELARREASKNNPNPIEPPSADMLPRPYEAEECLFCADMERPLDSEESRKKSTILLLYDESKALEAAIAASAASELAAEQQYSADAQAGVARTAS